MNPSAAPLTSNYQRATVRTSQKYQKLAVIPEHVCIIKGAISTGCSSIRVVRDHE